VAKARALLFHESRNMILFTERFHFFHRYQIKGVRHLVFYQLPTYPRFYSELCNLLHPGLQGKKFCGDQDSGAFSCTSLFCWFDAPQLAAVAGSERVTLLLDPDLKTHTFVSTQKRKEEGEEEG
jgi:U3 small nucleolar RNA-associated protein 25